MLIGRATGAHDVVFGIYADEVIVCGERVTGARKLAALFGFGAGRWPRAPKARA